MNRKPKTDAKTVDDTQNVDHENSLDTGTLGQAPPVAVPKPATKHQLVLDHLKRLEGATVPELIEATGWLAHSVRGFLSGTVRKKLGLVVKAELVADRGRVYRILQL